MPQGKPAASNFTE